MRSGGTDWRYGYQGRYAEDDKETGWNAFELRHYDAAIGRWLTMDAAGQYHSPYLGMGNDPVNRVDPDGNWSLFGAKWRQVRAFVKGQNPTRISGKGGEYGFYTRSGGVADGEANVYATGNFKPCANLADQIIAPNLTPVGQYNPATGMIQGSGQITPVYIEFDIALTAYTLGGYTAGRVAVSAVNGVSAEGAVWAQKTFSAGGKFAGQTVDGVAGMLRSSTLSAADVPINVVVRNGQTFILNTRSSAALMQAGIPRSSWNIINQTGVSSFESMLTGQLGRNSLINGTNTIRQSGTQLILSH